MTVNRDCMLFMVDALNLFYSARELYGASSRIDFRKLRDHVVGDRSFGVVYSIAFMPQFKEEPKQLFNAIKRTGYEISSRTPDFELRIMNLIDIAQSYQVVAVASGAQAFHPLYNSLKEAHIRTEAYSFRDAANAELPGLVDKFEFLGPEILVGAFKTLEEENLMTVKHDDTDG